jgi:4-amino-4-deoxy-L-arabinose transferase-like glycosyltransferase
VSDSNPTALIDPDDAPRIDELNTSAGPTTPRTESRASMARALRRLLLAPEAWLVIAAFVLYAWGLDKNGYGNGYYAAAAKSATMSWKNLWYGSLDPGGWITTDKPPLTLWLQGLSARAFGFSSWSLLLPSAACGALAVGLLAATTRKVAGRAAGLVAGGVLALTPAMMAVSRSNNPDAVLVLSLVAAAYATQRAISEKKPGWMILAGVFCGVGFLGKLLVAGLIMPGLWAAYLLAGPGRLRRRIRDLVLAAGAFVAVAAVWVATVDLVPSSDRPFIGSSTNGSALNLVFGYNGIGRLTGNSGPGGVSFPGGGGGGFGALGGGVSNAFGGATGPLRLFNTGMGDQVMWVVVFALISLVAGLVLAIRRRERNPNTGALVMWGGWFAVTYIVFAFMSGIFHNYYVSVLAPAVAALCGIGVELARRAGRAGAMAVAVAAVATIPLQLLLLHRVGAYRWLRVAIPAVLIGAAVVAIVVALRPATDPSAREAMVRWTAVGAVIVALVPSAIWTLSGTRNAQGALPEVRPVAKGAIGDFSPGGVGRPGGPGAAGTGGGIFGAVFPAAELRWLESQHNGERWIVAVSSSTEADDAIISGHSVMAMGGFSGGDPAMTPTKLADLVANGQLRFVSTGGGGFGGFGGAGSTAVNQAVTKACTAIPATRWGGTGTSTVYDCKGKQAAIRAVKTTKAASTPAGRGNPFPGVGGPGGTDFTKLQTCLENNGVKASGGQPNFADPAFAKAMQKCQAYLGGFPGIPGGPEGGGPPGRAGLPSN